MPDPDGPPRRELCRLLLLCHAATAATRRAAFACDEPAEDRGLAAAAALAPRLPGRASVLASPALCARQTAAALGLAPIEEAGLRDCDWGRWRGRTLDEVAAAEPEAAASWLADPAAVPHGGESLASLLGRVGTWMDRGSLAGPVLAVTHPAVMRAAAIHALGASLSSFWRLDVPPLSLIELRGRPGRWSLRAASIGGANSGGM